MALKYRGGPTSDSSIVVGRREARRVAEQCRHDANAALNLSPFTPSNAGRQEVVIGSQSQPQLEDGSVYRARWWAYVYCTANFPLGGLDTR